MVRSMPNLYYWKSIFMTDHRKKNLTENVFGNFLFKKKKIYQWSSLCLFIYITGVNWESTQIHVYKKRSEYSLFFLSPI